MIILNLWWFLKRSAFLSHILIFFQHALQLAKPRHSEEVLVVGDTLESDILGGNNAGLDTCWLHYGRDNQTAISPTYQIETIAELLPLVEKKS